MNALESRRGPVVPLTADERAEIEKARLDLYLDRGVDLLHHDSARELMASSVTAVPVGFVDMSGPIGLGGLLAGGESTIELDDDAIDRLQDLIGGPCRLTLYAVVKTGPVGHECVARAIGRDLMAAEEQAG